VATRRIALKAESKNSPRVETLGPLPAREQFLILKEGDTLILTDDQIPGRPAQFDEDGKLISPARIGCTLPAVFSDVRMGESIWFDDGKIGGVIESVESQQVTVELLRPAFAVTSCERIKGLTFRTVLCDFPR
jgi:pyruvate kinase